MFRGSVKGTGYPLHSPVSPSLPLPCVTVCHHISNGLYKYVPSLPCYTTMIRLKIFAQSCQASYLQHVTITVQLPDTSSHLICHGSFLLSHTQHFPQHIPNSKIHKTVGHYHSSVGDCGGTVVKVLCYKSECRWFDPSWCQWIFDDIKSFRSHYGPGVDSASNRNEYQEYFLGVTAAGA